MVPRAQRGGENPGDERCACARIASGKTILLDGIGDELFWGAIVHRPFLFIRVPDVYLAPGSEASITSHPDLGNISQYILPAAEIRRGLASMQIVVYRAGEGPLRNITTRYQVPAGLE